MRERDVWNTIIYHRAIRKKIGEALFAGYDLSQPLPDRIGRRDVSSGGRPPEHSNRASPETCIGLAAALLPRERCFGLPGIDGCPGEAGMDLLRWCPVCGQTEPDVQDPNAPVFWRGNDRCETTEEKWIRGIPAECNSYSGDRFPPIDAEAPIAIPIDQLNASNDD
jgi:hypothetical protein